MITNKMESESWTGEHQEVSNFQPVEQDIYQQSKRREERIGDGLGGDNITGLHRQHCESSWKKAVHQPTQHALTTLRV